MPGKDAQASLEHYVWEWRADRYPEGQPPDVLKTVRHELDLIRTMKYAPFSSRYFRSRALCPESRAFFARAGGPPPKRRLLYSRYHIDRSLDQ